MNSWVLHSHNREPTFALPCVWIFTDIRKNQSRECFYDPIITVRTMVWDEYETLVKYSSCG